MGEVGPKTVQSRTKMAPGKLKLATSWPQDCMKADISQTCIKPTNSLGKTMILCIPHAQFASKMAQVRTKIRSKSDPSRSVVPGWPKLAPRWLHESPKRRHDGPTLCPSSGKMVELGAQDGQDRLHVALGSPKLAPRRTKLGPRRSKVGPTRTQLSPSWLEVAPKIARRPTFPEHT